MRRIDISISLLAILGIMLFNACQEVPPEIDYSEVIGDTTYIETPESPQPKVIMFEEFTGVKCTNCPAANDLSKTISESNPGRVIVAGLHSGGLAIPYDDSKHKSKYDFRVDEASAIAAHFEMLGQPQGMVDRVLFDGEQSIVLSKSSWSTRITSRLSETPPINLYIETQLDIAKNKLFVSVIAKFTTTLANPVNVSLGLTETDIIDLQGSKNTTDFPPDGVIPDYVHRHVLRIMPSGWHGVPLNSPDQVAGRVVVKKFEIDLTGKQWNLDKCSLYAFVHYSGAPSEEILQAAEVHVK